MDSDAHLSLLYAEELLVLKAIIYDKINSKQT